MFDKVNCNIILTAMPVILCPGPNMVMSYIKVHANHQFVQASSNGELTIGALIAANKNGKTKKIYDYIYYI